LAVAVVSCRALWHELDPAWVFVRREPAFYVLLKYGGEFRRLRRIGAQHHEGFWFYQPVIVALTHHRGFEHRLVRGKRGFNFEGGHPDAAHLEHIVGAAAVGEISVLAQ